jgi:hypothetical protein
MSSATGDVEGATTLNTDHETHLGERAIHALLDVADHRDVAVSATEVDFANTGVRMAGFRRDRDVLRKELFENTRNAVSSWVCSTNGCLLKLKGAGRVKGGKARPAPVVVAS